MTNATAEVVIAKVAELAPDGTVTVAGTWVAGLVLLRFIVIATGAAVVMATVPVAEPPPVNVDGLTPTDAMLIGIGVTSKLAVATCPLLAPDIVTDVFTLTALVVIGNVAEIAS